MATSSLDHIRFCKRCEQQYTLRSTMGHWQCRWHPVPWDARLHRYPCCGMDVQGARNEPWPPVEGCTPCDHDAPFSDDFPTSRVVLSSEMVRQHGLEHIVSLPSASFDESEAVYVVDCADWHQARRRKKAALRHEDPMLVESSLKFQIHRPNFLYANRQEHLQMLLDHYNNTF